MGGPSSAAAIPENPTASFTFPWGYKQSIGVGLDFDLLVSVEQLTETTFAIINIRVIGIGDKAAGLTPNQYRRAAKQLTKNLTFRRKATIALHAAANALKTNPNKEASQ